MKGREAKSTSSTDLLVCFPSRIQLALMHNPICSPGRTQDHNKGYRNNHRDHLKKSSTTRSIGQVSPLIWTNTKLEITEPTSPKVNCAGKIKVIRPKTTATKSWQSVMEEIEKIHNSNKHKKRSKLALSLSFKKEVMHLLACLSCMRLDLRCFGTLNPEGEDDEDIEDEGNGEKENHVGIEETQESDNENSGTVFSKWLMVLQENQTNGLHKEDKNNASSVEEAEEVIVPPPNALLLMRCRSAPVKSLLKGEKTEEQNEHNEEGKVKEKVAGVNKGKSLKSLMEENKKKENLVVMRYDSDFYKISSSEIAKDTWIVGGLRNSLPKSLRCNK
ncbi:hypothetical protein TanjilG_01637 [Lupinus angustifolius]|uniref:Uncharacterized protein n=1 Tax=Lupinus angustifolius TaxID=3871 RepID=A0A1J7GV62_LUPAN|nr:PREDICTED: uncharacterized protein LOC109356402 [Lupinus angustifolius]OIW04464.1 hypothetical protein TanjilG_01637 [Lupinus angustifolius]